MRTWPVFVGIAALSAAIYATRKRRRFALSGARHTVRKGKRTGAIEVDSDLVDLRVEQLLREFTPCKLDYDEEGKISGLQPTQDSSVPPISVKDVETEELKPIYVLLRPRKEYQPWIRGGGSLLTKVKNQRISQEIVIKPNKDYCGPPEAWRSFLRDTLTHEIAHARDPYVVKSLGRRVPEDAKANFRAYINSPVEVAAELAEVRRQLEDLRPMKLWRMADPLMILRTSGRYNDLEPLLREANKRRFMHLAARMQQTKKAEIEQLLRSNRSKRVVSAVRQRRRDSIRTDYDPIPYEIASSAAEKRKRR